MEGRRGCCRLRTGAVSSSPTGWCWRAGAGGLVGWRARGTAGHSRCWSRCRAHAGPFALCQSPVAAVLCCLPACCCADLLLLLLLLRASCCLVRAVPSPGPYSGRGASQGSGGTAACQGTCTHARSQARAPRFAGRAWRTLPAHGTRSWGGWAKGQQRARCGEGEMGARAVTGYEWRPPVITTTTTTTITTTAAHTTTTITAAPRLFQRKRHCTNEVGA